MRNWRPSFAANLFASIDWTYVLSFRAISPLPPPKRGCKHETHLIGDVHGETVTICNSCGERLR